MTKVLALIAAFGSIGAGVYLLDTEVPTNSLMGTSMHAVGLYFVAKGLYLGASLYLQDDIRTMLRARLQEDAGDKRAVAAASLERPEGV